MKQLILISLCTLIGVSTDYCSSMQINDLKKENYRLNTDVIPLDYVVDVTPYFDTNLNGKKPFTFDGVCTITIKATKSNIDSITLHKQYLDIVEQTLTLASNFSTTHPQMIETIGIKSNEYNNVTSKYTLKLTQPLVKDEPYVLKFIYSGKLQTDLHGFYYYSYEEGNSTRWLATTYFEPISARKMFPSFDEPRFRATFSIIINRPAHFKPSLSNTRLISSHHTPSNLVREYFEKSPPMPTYLVAVVISELECHENKAKNFSVCYRPSQYNNSGYSFEWGQRVQKAYDVMFDYKYSTDMKKLAIVALPAVDPAIGGEENWGVITCQEFKQLFDPKYYTIWKEQILARLNTHEVGHLWWGDIVTIDWYDNLWLKEGFARYFEYAAITVIEPTWGMDQQFIIDLMYPAFDDDSLESAWAMNYDANTPEELANKYVLAITYNKGASVIRMFNRVMGDEIFMSAAKKYIKENALTAAVPERLYEAFQSVVGSDWNVSETWGNWVTQPGYPVLNVHLSSDRKHIEITQKRFLRNNPNLQLKSLWKIPMTYASNNHNSDFVNTKPFAILSDKSMHIDLEESVDWIIFNVQQTGYYRVNYDDESWSAISNLLHKSQSSIHVLNRAQIINDALNLARASLLSYEKVLNIASYLQNEVEYAPWMAAFPNFEFILARFKLSEAPVFEEFALKLLNRAYEYHGFEGRTHENHLENFVRKDILKYACLWGHKGCLAQARTIFDHLVQRNASVHLDISIPVYCSVVEHGSETEWNFVWNKFKQSTDTYEGMYILESLSCTKQPHIMKKYLNLIISDEVPFNFRTAALPSTWRQKQNHDLIIDFILTRHKEINAAFAQDSKVAETLGKLASVLTNSEQIDRIQRFVDENGLDLNEKLKDALENARYNLKWADKNVPIIKSIVQQMNLSIE